MLSVNVKISKSYSSRFLSLIISERNTISNNPQRLKELKAKIQKVHELICSY